MQIEDLTKMQIVLLTLLVSFVTSMATGIVTVSLLDQAPKPVTQTINRIVERTVEKIVPDVVKGSAAVATVKETTVVVKEEDMITDAISKNEPHVARIYGSRGTSTALFEGMGVLVRTDGLIAADASPFRAPGAPESYLVALRGTTTGATLVFLDVESGVALFSAPGYSGIAAAIFSDESAAKIGQTVLALGGRERTVVSMGIISGVQKEAPAAGSGAPERAEIVFLTTTIPPRDTASGSPFFNLFGELVGIASFDGTLIPSGRIAHAVSAFASAASEAPARPATPSPSP